MFVGGLLLASSLGVASAIGLKTTASEDTAAMYAFWCQGERAENSPLCMHQALSAELAIAADEEAQKDIAKKIKTVVAQAKAATPAVIAGHAPPSAFAREYSRMKMASTHRPHFRYFACMRPRSFVSPRVAAPPFRTGVLLVARPFGEDALQHRGLAVQGGGRPVDSSQLGRVAHSDQLQRGDGLVLRSAHVRLEHVQAQGDPQQAP
jgi:hypothetical protein